MKILRGSTLVNDSGSVVNPATEDKQDDNITELQTVRVLDPSNSTVEDLGNGGIFEGAWINVLNQSSLGVELFTDQLSAVDGFKVESSDDGTTVNHTHSFLINAGTNKHYTFTLTGKYYRIRYINGVTPTTSFRIGASLSKIDQSHQHTHGVEFVITSDHPADLVRSVLTAKRADNAYANIRSTNGNNLKISLQELESMISSNGNSQLNVTQFDSSGRELLFDVGIPAPVSINSPHYFIHNSGHYTVTDVSVLADAGTRDLIITTPDTTKWGHFLALITGSLDTEISLYETTTHNIGAALTPWNNNRNSGNTAGLAINVSAGGGGDGNLTPFFRSRFGNDSGVGINSITGGGITRDDSEVIMKQNTKYLLRAKSNSDLNNVTNLMTWYENISQ